MLKNRSKSYSFKSYFKFNLCIQQYLKSSKLHNLDPLENIPNIKSTSILRLHNFFAIFSINSFYIFKLILFYSLFNSFSPVYLGSVIVIFTLTYPVTYYFRFIILNFLSIPAPKATSFNDILAIPIKSST